MARPRNLTNAKHEILAYFLQARQKIYSKTDLAHALNLNRGTWHIPEGTTTNDLISFLKRQGNLKLHELRAPKYDKRILRYSIGGTTPYEIALSIKPQSYLSHASATFLHGLVDDDPKTIYLNREQSAKPDGGGQLTQARIKAAFFGRQRQSNLIYSYSGLSIVQLAGKNTGRLGVVQIQGPNSELLSVTNLERTLVDIVVRPEYAGGTSGMLEAYRAARSKVNVDRLLQILSKLNHLYPYHQAIGFLMEVSGYPENDHAKLHAFGQTYDFYLIHRMKNANYSERWRLFYPPDIKL